MNQSQRVSAHEIDIALKGPWWKLKLPDRLESVFEAETRSGALSRSDRVRDGSPRLLRFVSAGRPAPHPGHLLRCGLDTARRGDAARLGDGDRAALQSTGGSARVNGSRDHRHRHRKHPVADARQRAVRCSVYHSYGIVLVILFANVVQRIRFWYAMAASLASFAIYVVAMREGARTPHGWPVDGDHGTGERHSVHARDLPHARTQHPPQFPPELARSPASRRTGRDRTPRPADRPRQSPASRRHVRGALAESAGASREHRPADARHRRVQGIQRLLRTSGRRHLPEARERRRRGRAAGSARCGGPLRRRGAGDGAWQHGSQRRHPDCRANPARHRGRRHSARSLAPRYRDGQHRRHGRHPRPGADAARFPGGGRRGALRGKAQRAQPGLAADSPRPIATPRPLREDWPHGQRRAEDAADCPPSAGGLHRRP